MINVRAVSPATITQMHYPIQFAVPGELLDDGEKCDKESVASEDKGERSQQRRTKEALGRNKEKHSVGCPKECALPGCKPVRTAIQGKLDTDQRSEQQSRHKQWIPVDPQSAIGELAQCP